MLRGGNVARGKYLSLEEARKAKKLDRFAKEHPSRGDEQKFDGLLDRMAKKKNKPAAQ
jgi:hypothetical protein